MVKIVSKGHFSISISKRFKNFWVVITSKLLWTLYLPLVNIFQAYHWGWGPKFNNEYKMWCLQCHTSRLKIPDYIFGHWCWCDGQMPT